MLVDQQAHLQYQKFDLNFVYYSPSFNLSFEFEFVVSLPFSPSLFRVFNTNPFTGKYVSEPDHSTDRFRY